MNSQQKSSRAGSVSTSVTASRAFAPRACRTTAEELAATRPGIWGGTATVGLALKVFANDIGRGP